MDRARVEEVVKQEGASFFWPQVFEIGMSKRKHPSTYYHPTKGRGPKPHDSDTENEDEWEEKEKKGRSPLPKNDRLLVELENFLKAPCVGGDERAHLIDHAVKDGLKNEILEQTGLFLLKNFLAKLPNLILLDRGSHVQFDRYHAFALTLDALSLEALIEALIACDTARRDAYEKAKTSSSRTRSEPKIQPRDITLYYMLALQKRGLFETLYQIVILRPDLAGSALHPQQGTFFDLAIIPFEQDEDEDVIAQEDAETYRAQRVTRRYFTLPDGGLVDEEGRRLKPFRYLNTRPSNKKVFAPAMVLNFLNKILHKERIEGADVWQTYDPEIRRIKDLTLVAAFYILADPLTQSSLNTVDFDGFDNDGLGKLIKSLQIGEGPALVPALERSPPPAPPSPPPAPPANAPSTPSSSRPPHLPDPDATARPARPRGPMRSFTDPGTSSPTPSGPHARPSGQEEALQGIDENLYTRLMNERYGRMSEAELELERLPVEEKKSILLKLSSFDTPWNERMDLLLRTLFAGEEPFLTEAATPSPPPTTGSLSPSPTVDIISPPTAASAHQFLSRDGKGRTPTTIAATSPAAKENESTSPEQTRRRKNDSLRRCDAMKKGLRM
ncbi:Proteophosphoglycan ppg4 [Rhodotorula toruloides ATCC 204091]|uniref:Proteophosphoglycan ppg4 n=1 Tax=Rhodotorula toruloides TaxID=5286 RepID=A0A0K3CM84_RHOTO|nr:Proteophosphoglycan ppg4 [Rhodotorula toruloides ATCC 204091]KAK4329697.1 Proteophosphoglycan ppg4 [Rhodotorula toruloides]PRQ72279.1 Proteophosphoglycan ppg4 [Rhodotorula toruloides]